MTYERTEAFRASDGKLLQTKSEAKTHEIGVCETRLAEAIEGHLNKKYAGGSWNEYQIATVLEKELEELTALVSALRRATEQAA